MATTKSAYLEFIEPAINKDAFYRVEVTEQDGEYATIATFGRRGAAGQQTVKYQGSDEARANAAFDKAYAEKTAKGYVKVA